MDKSPCRGCHLEFKDKNNHECQDCLARLLYVEKMSSRPSEPFKTKIIKKEKRMQKIQKVKVEKAEIEQPKIGKLCKTCGKVKLVSEFSVDKSKKDGLSYHCRECASIYKKAWKLKRKTEKPNKKTHVLFYPPAGERPLPEPPPAMQNTQFQIITVCDEIKKMLLDKNRKYGDSAIHPQRIFSKADPVEQINIRIDDKISRLLSGQADEDEDIEFDLIGYLILRRIARTKIND